MYNVMERLQNTLVPVSTYVIAVANIPNKEKQSPEACYQETVKPFLKTLPYRKSLKLQLYL